MGDKNVELDIKLGYMCNNNCIFCLNKDKKHIRKISVDVIKNTIYSIHNTHGVKKLVISGGEPLIFPELFEILEIAEDCSIESIEIQTNGRKLKDKVLVDKLERYDLSLHFLISFHFLSPQVYKSMCRSDGFFEVISGIRNIVSSSMNVTTNTVVMMQNINSLERLVESLNSMGIRNMNFRFIDGKNVTKEYYRFVPRLKEAARKIENIIEKYGNKVKITLFEFPFCVLRKKYHRFIYLLDPQRVNLSSEERRRITTSEIYNLQFINPPKCKGCKLEGICPGIRKEYYEFYGDSELIPI